MTEKKNKKKYGYLFLVLYVPLYLIMFFLVERYVPDTAEYWVSYCFLDDYIPFDERFIVFYWMWYPYMVAIGIFLMLKDIPSFKLYMYFIALSFTFSIIFCAVFPNGQDLRPEVFARDNVFTAMVKMIYAADTNTNVIPSIHVVGSCAGVFGVLNTKRIKGRFVKTILVLLGIIISISTVFVKQHSVLDIFAGLIVSAAFYVVVYVIIKKYMSRKQLQ
jgi:membrane-associated phospholipid phosphatase